MVKQRTFRNAININGIGIHSNKKVNMRVSAAPVNSGIIFRIKHTDSIIKAFATNTIETNMSTTITDGINKISTIEHLMASFAGFGIDNAYIDIDSNEVPILDGSASDFVFLIQSAGLKLQDAHKKFIKITEDVYVQDGDKYASLSPYNGSKLSFEISFEHKFLQQQPQTKEIEFSTTEFIKNISRARTFGFLKDIEYLHSHNLALGAGVNNAIVIRDNDILNEEPLRYKEEFVIHKILDALGDLYLSGHTIIGHYHGYKSGHTLNNRLVRTLFANSHAYEIVTFDSHDELPIDYHRALV